MTNIDKESVLIDTNKIIIEAELNKIQSATETIRKHTDHFSLMGKMCEQPVSCVDDGDLISMMCEAAWGINSKTSHDVQISIMQDALDSIRPYLKQPTLEDETLREALQEIYRIYDNAEDLQTIRALKQVAFIAEMALKGQLPKPAMTKRELMQLVLEHLSNFNLENFGGTGYAEETITALSKAGVLNVRVK